MPTRQAGVSDGTEHAMPTSPCRTPSGVTKRVAQRRSREHGFGGCRRRAAPEGCEHRRVGATSAEREGFEPSVRLPVHLISSQAPSTTRSPLRVYILARSGRNLAAWGGGVNGRRRCGPVRASLLVIPQESCKIVSLRGDAEPADSALAAGAGLLGIAAGPPGLRLSFGPCSAGGMKMA